MNPLSTIDQDVIVNIIAKELGCNPKKISQSPDLRDQGLDIFSLTWICEEIQNITQIDITLLDDILPPQLQYASGDDQLPIALPGPITSWAIHHAFQK